MKPLKGEASREAIIKMLKKGCRTMDIVRELNTSESRICRIRLAEDLHDNRDASPADVFLNFLHPDDKALWVKMLRERINFLRENPSEKGNKLSLEQREARGRRYWDRLERIDAMDEEGFTEQDVAAALGISEGEAARMLARVRKKKGRLL